MPKMGATSFCDDICSMVVTAPRCKVVRGGHGVTRFGLTLESRSPRLA